MGIDCVNVVIASHKRRGEILDSIIAKTALWKVNEISKLGLGKAFSKSITILNHRCPKTGTHVNLQYLGVTIMTLLHVRII